MSEKSSILDISCGERIELGVAAADDVSFMGESDLARSVGRLDQF